MWGEGKIFRNKTGTATNDHLYYRLICCFPNQSLVVSHLVYTMSESSRQSKDIHLTVSCELDYFLFGKDWEDC